MFEAQSSQLPMKVYEDEQVEFKKEVSFDSAYRDLRRANDAIREKNSQILFNLRRISEEIDMKNKIKQAQIREAYSNLTDNTRSLLNGVRTRNMPYSQTLQRMSFYVIK